MGLLSVLLSGLLGLLAGVVVTELADGLPGPVGSGGEDGEETAFLWRPRTCLTCGQVFPRLRLLPLVDWWRWRGRCPTCRTRIPPRTAWTELAVALIWIMLTVKFGITPLGALFCFYTAVLALIFVIDLEQRLILDVVSYPAIALAIPLFLLGAPQGWQAQLGGALVAGVLFVGLSLGGRLCSGQEALGWGDVKLAVLIGVLTGWPAVLQALFTGCVLAALFSSALLVLRRHRRGDTIPLGTFLCVGALLVILWR